MSRELFSLVDLSLHLSEVLSQPGKFVKLARCHFECAGLNFSSVLALSSNEASVLKYIPDDRNEESDVLLCHVLGIFEVGLIQLI
jgi:hypothetical protein